MKFNFSDRFYSAFQKHHFFFHLGLSAFLFLLVKFFLGNFYEVYEFFIPATLCGKLMDGMPANIIYPIANIGLGQVYIWLYSLNADVPWYDWMMAAFMVLSTAVVFSAIFASLCQQGRAWQITAFNVALFLLFIAEHIVNWNITRGAFIMCIAAFICFALILAERKFSMRMCCMLLANAALFILGFLVRPESGELILILGTGYLFFRYGFKKEIWLRFLPFIIPAVCVAGYLTYERHQSTEFYLQLEPITEYQIWLGNMVPISEMKTAEDSMKYVALKEGIVNDPEKISNEFVKRVVAGKSSLRLEKDLFVRAASILLESIKAYPHLLFLNLFLTTIFFVSFIRKGKWLGYIFFHAFFWALIFSICYLMVMEPRIFGAALFFYTAGNLIFLFQSGCFSQFKPNALKHSLIAAGCITILAQLYLMNISRNDYEKNIIQNRLRFQALENTARNNLLVPDANAFMIIFFNNFTPFQTPNFSAFKKVFMMDLETKSLHPGYRSYLDKNCGCNSADLGEFYDYLYSHKEEVVLVGELHRWQFFESYLKIVHHKNYSFKSVGFIPPITISTDLQTDTIQLLRML